MGKFGEQPKEEAYKNEEELPVEPGTQDIDAEIQRENDENKSKIGDSIEGTDSFLDEMDKENHKKDKGIERKYQS